MAVAVGGSSAGVSFIASSLSVEERRYDPVYDQEMSGEPLLQLLPSYYRLLMQDSEVLSSIYAGVMQTLAGVLLDAWQADYSKSLRDIPVRSQRKWIRYDFLETALDSVLAPTFTYVGLTQLFSWDASEEALDVSWVNRAGVDRAGFDLRDETTENGSLQWSANFRIDASQEGAALLIGYFNSNSISSLKDAIFAGVKHDQGGGDRQAFIAHVSAAGGITSAASAAALSLDTDYRVECSYTAESTELLMTLFALSGEKVSATTGTTAEDDDGDSYTNLFTSSGADFIADEVIAGDYLVIEEVRYEILAVDAETLTTVIANLPAGKTVTFTVEGKLRQGSVSVDLSTTATDPTFTVDQFGTSNLDLIVGSSLFSDATLLPRRKMSGATWSWSYLDPTVEATLLNVPQLRDKILEPSTLLHENTDYTISGKTFLFPEPPQGALWAEFSAYDEEVIQNNFGRAVGLKGGDSEDYLSKVQGLYYSYWQGPTISSIQRGVHILIGLPIAAEAGTVESINPAYSGDHGQIVVSGRGYLYPLSVGTLLNVGDDVDLFEPLCEGVEIKDYIKDPLWFLDTGIHEVQKYHSFQIRLDLDAFDLSTFSLAASFVDTIQPTWKDNVFRVFRGVEDTVELDDDLAFTVSFALYDTVTDYPDPAYSSEEWEGDDYDWRYGQGVNDWDETSAAMRGSGKVLTEETVGAEYLTGTLTLSASTSATGSGTLFTSEIGSGALTDTFIMVAKRTTGTAGQHDALSNVFTDLTAGAFSEVVSGDTMNVGGTDYEVQSVTDDNNVVLDHTFGSTGSSLSWTHTGKLLLWCEVVNVGSDTGLTWGTSFTGDAGTYVASLVDVTNGTGNYKDIFYGMYLEYSIEDPLENDLDISVGYNETALTGTVTFDDASTTVAGAGTDFVNEIGSGAVTDKYIVDRAGEWYLVSSVTDATTLDLSATPSADFSAAPTYLASTVLTGTLSFTYNSTAVTGSGTVFTSELAAGDWIQAVPGSYAVVKVQSVTDDTNLVLASNYPDNPAPTGVKVIDRGADASIFPLTVVGSPSPGSFTDFNGTTGGLVERDVD